MSLSHALLNALLEYPGSGLELARRFDRSVGFFWPATHQQIYRELGRLEEAGLVKSTAQDGSRGRKKPYQVLPAGRQALETWVAQVDDPPALRDALLVRLRCEALLQNNSVANDLKHRLAQHQQQLADYRAIEQRDFADRPLNRAQTLRYLLLQSGLKHEANQAEFCKRALALIEVDS